MASRHRAALEDSLDDATAAAARVLQGARQRLSNLLVRGPENDAPERYQGLLRTARREMERAERDLGSKSRGNKSVAIEPADLQTVFDALPHGWGLVAYASYRSEGKRRYVAFVRGAVGEPAAMMIGDADRVDALVRQWKRDILAAAPNPATSPARTDAAARKSGRSLRAAIWDPVRAALGNVDGVLLVPDGSLHGINFSALPEQDDTYLVEGRIALHYVTSELDIPATRARAPHGVGLLAFGGVDFGVDVSSRTHPHGGTGGSEGGEEDCGSFYDANFVSLPQSRSEVDDISRAWGDSAHATVMIGSQATEEAFKRLAPGRRVLHLATHGFFLNPSRCLQELAGSRGIGGLELGVRPRPRLTFDQQSPLLLSGLALAAANRRSEATPHEEDGILTAEEVASLDLRGVEWAVLSACDTGVSGDPRGEGILGLRRAFQTAGVATLVISLWPVQDEAAREWMRALYQSRFHNGVDTAHAVRAATLEVLRNRRAQGRSTNPFFWAAFVAAGDWE
jgi:CHAT domain-containing protein